MLIFETVNSIGVEFRVCVFLLDREKKEKIADIRRNVRDSILSITGAMTRISPPEQLEIAENQTLVDYVQTKSTLPEFSYPRVRFNGHLIMLTKHDLPSAVFFFRCRNSSNTLALCGVTKVYGALLNGHTNINSSIALNSKFLVV